MPSRSSRATVERFSYRPTSTRAGRRSPTSSAHPRTPCVCSTHMNRLSQTLALEPDRIAGALGGVDVQIGYKGAPALPTRETKRWNHEVSSRRFLPVLGLCVRCGHCRTSRCEGGGPLRSSSSAGSTWARFLPAHLAGCERWSLMPSAVSTPPTAAARCCRAARAGPGAQA